MSALDRINRLKLVCCVLACVLTGVVLFAGRATASKSDAGGAATANPAATAPQTAAPAPAEGCATCHNNIEPMHKYGPTGVAEKIVGGKDAVGLSCTACHGGNPVATTQEAAHVQPKYPEAWQRNGKYSSANPERSNTLLARESWEFVRFVNPGDLRVSAQTCGACHATESSAVARSMMATGQMLWGAALYNNGGFPLKDARFAESYSEDGGAQTLLQTPAPSRADTQFRGQLSILQPLPVWNVSQPGNVLRVFERGGRRRLEVGLPDREEEPGKPDKGLSPRGLGTNNRTDPVFLGLQKTRLLDPTLNFLGTNDHAGDYRSSGCAACHVIYANDRDPFHSAQYAGLGNQGQSRSADEKIPRNEPGHPIKHQFTSAIPSSQCMTCHMHPGTNMVASFMGLTWWDNESDGARMYPERQVNPSQDQERERLEANPEGASVRGRWSDPNFLQQTGTPEFNATLQRNRFADFHGHGWVFRAVYKRSRHGQLLDADDNVIAAHDPNRFAKAVHLKDIHLEKGMQCADCHFRQDSHGNGFLYNEPRAGIEIDCVDCHGSAAKTATLFTSGPAAQPVTGRVAEQRKSRGEPLIGMDLVRGVKVRDADGGQVPLFQRITADRKKRNEQGVEVQLRKGDIVQNSIVTPGRWWRVPQTAATIDPASPDYNEKSRFAKTIQVDNQTWGGMPADPNRLAHRDNNMTCYSCHSSWVTSCFGCHLSMRANKKMPNRHFEGGDSRNFTTYNYQVLRDDIFMLGIDGTVTGHRVAPVRSSSAVLVSSQNQNREWIYSQQQTISAEGYSGQTFNTHVPHTVRSKETKGCADCHVSAEGDNNAWLAQLMLQGTNFVNFIGRYVYVAADDALEAVAVTEHTEPQAVFGSTLQRIAYPENYRAFERNGRRLDTVYEHAGNPQVLAVQVRGEYAYVAAGEGGLRIYDVAQIDHKGFSERITTAPVSPLGQRFYVDTKYATAVAAPSTLAVDPARWKMTVDPEGNYRTVSPAEGRLLWEQYMASPAKLTSLVNEEQPIHPLYAYLYVADKYEGLILVNAATLLDGDPLNNFLSRAVTFNPAGILNGASSITIAGNHAIITSDNGLVFVNIDDPLHPVVERTIGAPDLKHPKAIAVQFRYGFVVDDEGLKVVDLSNLNDHPERISVVDAPLIQLKDAHDVYVARTYAYVAAGHEGIAIVDVEKPKRPRLDQMFNAGGALSDTHQVKVAMTNASLYAYVADGKNGLKVLQLTDPETDPNYAGFSPRPQPRLIASYKTKGEALAISKPLDRDRAVDESGNQVAVFGRRGARPFNLTEMQQMLRTENGTGPFFTVTGKPETAPIGGNRASSDGENSPATSERVSGGAQAKVKPLAFGLLGMLGFFAIVWKIRGNRLRYGAS